MALYPDPNCTCGGGTHHHSSCGVWQCTPVVGGPDPADLDFFFEDMAPPTDRLQCVDCGVALCDVLDAYYGTDWYEKRRCSAHRKRYPPGEPMTDDD